MKYYFREGSSYVAERWWLFKFKTTRTTNINPSKWGFRNPVQMVNSKTIASHDGKPCPFPVKVIPEALIIDGEYQLIKRLFNK